MWPGVGMCGWGVCVAGGVCMAGGHVWPGGGACVAGGGAYMPRGGSCMVRGACVAGECMHAQGCMPCMPPPAQYYEIRSVNEQAVRILLECILVSSMFMNFHKR